MELYVKEELKASMSVDSDHFIREVHKCLAEGNKAVIVLSEQDYQALNNGTGLQDLLILTGLAQEGAEHEAELYGNMWVEPRQEFVRALVVHPLPATAEQ